jgi:hypothetical protein
MLVTHDQIEFIARALYDAQDCARGWDREPERLRQAFRQDAQAITTVLFAAEAEDDPSGCRKVHRRIVVESDVFQTCSAISLTSARLVARSRDQIRYSKARIAQSWALLRSQTQA